MSSRALLLLGVTTAVLWVVPSIGTQGMGTVGQQIVHPDAPLFDADPARRPAARVLLTHADDVAETTLGM